MANKVGPLIKEARTGAKLTQEQLAKKIAGLTAADISKAERGEIELSQAQLKAIAKATEGRGTEAHRGGKKAGGAVPGGGQEHQRNGAEGAEGGEDHGGRDPGFHPGRRGGPAFRQEMIQRKPASRLLARSLRSFTRLA